MEKAPENFEQGQPKQEIPLEQQANYEGNCSLLLFSRMENTVVRKQLLDLLYKAEEAHLPFVEVLKLNDKGKFIRDNSGEFIKEPVPYERKSRSDIEVEFNKKLEEIQKDTPITLENRQPSGGGNREMMSLTWCWPTGEKLTVKQKNIVEAHEKGHYLRNLTGDFHADFFRKHFSAGFDPTSVKYADNDYEMDLKLIEERAPEDSLPTKQETEEMFFSYLFSGREILERMAQLKNYFGMKGGEPFTKEHLDYARANYVKDTGIDNRMSHFFKAITPATENEFLRLINSSGV